MYDTARTSDDRFAVGNLELEISKGGVGGHSSFRIIGQNPSIASGEGYADVYAGGSVSGGTQVYVPPTSAQVHVFVSDDAADAGTVLSSGSVSSATETSMTDTGADFVSDGVAVSDLILDDSNIFIARVINVTTTVLTVIAWFHPSDGLRENTPVNGNAYRVVTPASTGSGVVHVDGLNAFFNSQEEFIVLNGTSTVNSIKLWARINRIRGLGAGSSNEVVGIVKATALGDNTVTIAIIDGDNVSLSSVFTVPRDSDGFMVRWSGAIAKKTSGIATVRLRIGPTNSTSYVDDVVDLNSIGSNNFERCLGHTRLPGGIDVRVEADTDSTMSISASIDIVLVKR